MRLPLALALTLAASCNRPPPHAPFHRVAPRAVTVPAGTDVASYTFDVRLEPSHRVITGTERITWRNRSDTSVDHLWWHLYMNAFEGPNTLFMRTGGLGGHRGNTPGANGHIDVTAIHLSTGEDLLATATNDPDVANDRTQLLTSLPRAIAPGEEITLDVTFRTTLPRSFARTGYAGDFTFAAQWFPKLAVLERDGTWAHFPFHTNAEFYADFGRYEATLTAPASDVVGACGLETEPPSRVGNELRHHFVAEHVHDFAWTSWAGFEESWHRADDFEVRLLAPPGLAPTRDRLIRSLRRAATDFHSRYGGYPYAQLTVVVPPRHAHGVGGMEYPTLITSQAEWFLPESVHDIEWVTVHEFAHQYFYGLFASSEWSWPFLDEGLAEYATGRVLTDVFGRDRELFDGIGLSFGYRAFEGGPAAATDDRIPVASRSDAFPSYLSYGEHVYRRTAAILESAEDTFGAERVDRALRTYAERVRFAHPVPRDLFDAFRETDPEMGAFVEAAITGSPELNDRITGIAGAGNTTQVSIEHHGPLHLPRTVEVSFADGSTRRTRVTDTAAPLRIESASAPVAARIDPDRALAIDRNRLDDARAVDSDHAGRNVDTAARLSFWFEALLRLVGP